MPLSGQQPMVINYVLLDIYLLYRKKAHMTVHPSTIHIYHIYTMYKLLNDNVSLICLCICALHLKQKKWMRIHTKLVWILWFLFVTLCCRLQLYSSDFLIWSSSFLHRSVWLDSFSDSSSFLCLTLVRCFNVAGDSTSTVWVTYWQRMMEEKPTSD